MVANEIAATRANAVSAAEHFAIEQFLFLEAELLDGRNIAAWIELMADDLRYVMPIRRNVGPRERKVEWTSPDELAYFDESKENLKLRLRKLQSGAAWAEEPPSHTRHLITNVRASAAGQGEYLVRSNFLAYRNRSERQTDYLIGERHDRLRCVDTDAGFQIVSRRILLDQTTFLANNLSFFL
ncbi:3-phenylpropionate/cinnamic acid dioxygenase subunit beta [Burkholderia sp. AU30280]|uniref:aromatic-ring-hydroxylating dioxygenase subunit beta n=1 Tax=Burkholderia sp. AU30280 TaxID=2879628 RepID=UPI001CF33622|nr:3-phenylpropionate/cinnamic acid dioxygenase subunit beta [Burkholderia sp. AU30280]MCA8276468.1 3-phenylpropionate/cinnamic acid dioxygenase subunit beta [Burkholderia sp. AU30280]